MQKLKYEVWNFIHEKPPQLTVFIKIMFIVECYTQVYRAKSRHISMIECFDLPHKSNKGWKEGGSLIVSQFKGGMN